MCCGSWFEDFKVVVLDVEESRAAFWIFDVRDITAESMSEGVYSVTGHPLLSPHHDIHYFMYQNCCCKKQITDCINLLI